MSLGIRPINDMAFKKTFGTPENKISLISLLNAILDLDSPIVDVTIENPYNLQDFESDKLSILDIKAVDQSRAIYDVEMQLSIFAGLIQRIVFYGCELYSGQLKSGVDYTEICPVYSICLLDGILWKDATEVHHRFQLCDRKTQRVLDKTMEIHTLELGRYNLTEAELAKATPLERWLFWLLHAHEYETEELLRLFPETAFQLATQTITQISLKTEDKAMYDAREKAIRDHQWAINSALKEGEQRGIEIGEQRGIEIGEQRGIEIGEQRGEQRGIEIGEQIGELRGTLMGKIELLQGILGISATDQQTLRGMTTDELDATVIELQSSVRDRTSG